MTERDPLPPEKFDKLLLWLDPDRDRAGAIYEKIRLRLIRIFSSRGCCDGEDLADQTINVVASKIDWLIENYNGNPALYFYAVAKKIYLESLKKKRVPNIPPPDPPDSTAIEVLCNYLDQCLQGLAQADRALVIRYQEGEKQERIKNRKKLASEREISMNGLRIKVFHLHSRLRRCIERLLRQNPIE